MKLVVSGAGAAAIACLDLFVQPRRASARTSSSPTSTAWSTQGRNADMDPNKARYAQDTRRARWPTSSRAPTSSSACRPAAC